MKMRQIAMGAMAAVTLLTACQQQKAYPIFFLTEEADAAGFSAKMLVMYNGKPYTRQPILNHEHLQSFHSFMNMKDGSYGVVFTLKREMRNRLYTITQEKRGMQILPVVNGLAFQPVLIDKPVTDGKLVIWGGLNGYDLMRIARDIEPENKEIEEKRFLKENPRPIPTLNKDTQNRKKDHTGQTVGEIFSAGS